ncbi:hypothetical protein EUGRSUZ_F03207 [Eucalyptus grandis]|uniref:Uncharacterized protein n=2 Tax=Eucalyptus grandis TaxID=71139 RepID=A0ACC3KLI3_EUCGR|nr:hypothetical protein EUGRSUZ_F03207 [Eucalyptus grandis]
MTWIKQRKSCYADHFLMHIHQVQVKQDNQNSIHTESRIDDHKKQSIYNRVSTDKLNFFIHPGTIRILK